LVLVEMQDEKVRFISNMVDTDPDELYIGMPVEVEFVDINDEWALPWFRKAANQGHPAALYLMGAVYLEGWSEPADKIEAYKWFTLALKVADQAKAYDLTYDPARALRRLRPKMNKFQVKRAEEAAARFRPMVPAR